MADKPSVFGMLSARDRGMSNLTYIDRQPVIDAVDACREHGRPFADFWFYYMNPRERDVFPSFYGFIAECESRYRLLLK